MSSSLTPKQVTENALREKAKLEDQVKYLQSQLGQLSSVKKEFERLKESHETRASFFNPREKKATQMAHLVMKVKKEGHFVLEGEETLILRLTMPSLRAN